MQSHPLGAVGPESEGQRSYTQFRTTTSTLPMSVTTTNATILKWFRAMNRRPPLTHHHYTLEITDGLPGFGQRVKALDGCR